MRWEGQGAKIIGNGFKFLWSEGCKAENGVDVIVANRLIRKIVGVERYNDRAMKVNIVIGDELMDKVVTSERLVGGDFNGHVSSDMSDFGDVHGGFGQFVKDCT